MNVAVSVSFTATAHLLFIYVNQKHHQCCKFTLLIIDDVV